MPSKERIRPTAPRIRCHAKNRQGEQCGRWAAPGQRICHSHGAAAPQNVEAARRRLDRLLDPAIDLLGEVLKAGPAGRHAMRAVVAVLDRCGFPATRNVEITDPTTAKAALASILGVEPGQLPEE
jgi:hypothetical protein